MCTALCQGGGGYAMELDAKHQVLYAIYAEYQKDLPDMQAAITFRNLDMDCRVFKAAVEKLQNEGLIQGAAILRGDGKILYINVKDMLPTRTGIEYVEAKMAIDRGMTGRQKVAALKEKFGKLGWETLIDVAAKVLCEMGKQAV